MINSQKLPPFNRNTDQFTSYYSSIPEFPQFCPLKKKQKEKHKNPTKSLTRQPTKKSISTSKKQYQLQIEPKPMDSKKAKRKSQKSISYQSTPLHYLLSSTKSAYLQKSPIKKSPLVKMSPSTSPMSNVGKSVKTNVSQKLATCPQTIPQACNRSRSISLGRSQLNKMEFQKIIAKCTSILNEYKERVNKLQEDNKRLLAENKTIKLQIKSAIYS